MKTNAFRQQEKHIEINRREIIKKFITDKKLEK